MKRNIVENVPDDAAQPNGWNNVSAGLLESIKEPVKGVGGVNTPTASTRNIVKSVPEDTSLPNGWKKSSAGPDNPASGKRRVRGKLSVKEVKEMKMSCHNIEGMFKKKLEKLSAVSVTTKNGQQSTPLGPIADLSSEVQCTGVQSVGSPCEPLCTRDGFNSITYRAVTHTKKSPLGKL